MAAYLTMMAIRLLELKRVLRPDGSLYLHCDDTASHYLKQVLDLVFGPGWYRNEIIWKRTTGRSDAQKYGRVHDTILYYASPDATWNTVYRSHDPDYIKRSYRHKDPQHGPYRVSELVAKGDYATGSWKGVTPYPGKSWQPPTKKGSMTSWIQANVLPDYPDAYPTVYDRLDALDDAGLIYWPPRGTVPGLKRYLATSKGRAVEDIFTDIGPLQHASKERVGYPTQKPVALIQRLIQASPATKATGCWTRSAGAPPPASPPNKPTDKWIGIDISPKAAQLVAHRLETELGLFNTHNPRTDLPQHDQTHIPPPHTHKHTLYGTQEGKCNGCQHHFPYRNLTIDHKTPRSKGGTNHPTTYNYSAKPATA